MRRLAVLVLDCGAAFLLVRWMRAGNSLPDFRSLFRPRSKPRLHVLKRPVEENVPIDVILEKISQSGMVSLTSRERRTLEKAREELLEKERNQ